MTLDILQQKLTDIFGDNTMVKGMDSVFEETERGKILVLSIHELTLNEEIVIHTKFIFPVNDEKTETRVNFFRYLYDINCIYKQVSFENEEDLVDKINDILNNNKFGKDIKLLSDFIEAPGMFINDYFKQNNVSDYSVYDILYNPKYKITPCKETKFDFNITLNNNIKILLSIYKTDKNKYIATFKFENNVESFNINSLLNLHQFIGSKLIELLKQKSKD